MPRRRAGCTYLDMAMTLSEPHPTAPYERNGRDARRRPVRRRGGLGAGRAARARRHRRRAGPLGRLRPLRRRRAVLGDRRDRRARRREPRRRGLRLRTHVLDLDDDRGVPQPAAHLGAGARAGSRPSRSPSPRRSTSPRASARSSASTSSTKRSLLIPRWIDCKRVDVQVRARRRVHRRAEDAAQARARLDEACPRPRRRGEPARRRRRRAAEPGDARRPHDAARPARARSSPARARTASRAAPTSTTCVDNEQAMRDYGHQAVVCRPRSTRSSRSSCSPPGPGTGSGVLGPEAFPAVPFLELLADYGFPHGVSER